MRAKTVHESISFQRGMNPKQSLGIGGFDPKYEWENLQKQLKNADLRVFTSDDDEEEFNGSNTIILTYWKNLLEDTFIGKKVSGMMAVGNYDSHGMFLDNREPTSQIERIEVDTDMTNFPFDFALVTIEPGIYGGNDEVWYYVDVYGRNSGKLFIE
jgi:hypothetical protein